MNKELNATMHLIRHELETLETELGRDPERPTQRQRAQGLLQLLLMLERQISGVEV